MQRFLSLLLILLVAAPFLASLAPGLDECADGACGPIRCAMACPLCACALDRDRIAAAGVEPTPLEPALDGPGTATSSSPVVPTRDILKVPKLLLA